MGLNPVRSSHGSMTAMVTQLVSPIRIHCWTLASMRLSLAMGMLKEFAVNVIAECMYSQIDAEGRQQLQLQEIVDHRKRPDAVTINDRFVVFSNSNLVKRRTTWGCDICVEWKDQSTSWVSLKDLKEAYPVQQAEYVVMNRIDLEPALAWWVKDVLHQQEQILSKVKSRY